MAAWNDGTAIAKDRGSLAREFHVLESKTEKSPDSVMKNLPLHPTNQRDLEELEMLVHAGPRSGTSGNSIEGTGLIVCHAGWTAVVWQSAGADPMNHSGAGGNLLLKWTTNEGDFLLKVRPSASSIQPN